MQRVANMLVGTWKVDLEYAPGGSMPNGGKGTAHSVIKPGPGGFSLIEDFEGNLPQGSLHALYWWDKSAQAFKSMSCNDFSEEVCSIDDGLGRWEGNEVVWQLKIEKDGKTVPAKIVWVEKDNHSATATMYIADPSGAMKRDWTFLHVRVKWVGVNVTLLRGRRNDVGPGFVRVNRSGTQGAAHKMTLKKL